MAKKEREGTHQREILVEKWQINGAREGLWETINRGGQREETCNHRDDMGMSHLSELTSAMCTSDDSQICSRSEGAKHEGKVCQQPI